MKTLLITGGTLWSESGPAHHDRAILIKGDHIAAVGKHADFLSMPEAKDAVLLELNGETVIPGLSDGHVHLTAYAKQKTALDLFDVGSKQEMLELIQEKAMNANPDEWIYGYRYKESNWDVPGKITGNDLDSLNVPNPIHIVRVCGHVHVANKRARELGGGYEGPAGDGLYFETQADGIVHAMEKSLYSRQSMLDTIVSASRDFASLGVTSVHACGAQTYGLGEDYDLLQCLEETGNLLLRITFYDEKLPSFGIRSGFGSSFLRYGGFKIFLDGALGPRTAALSAPYHDDPCNIGILNHSLQDVVDMLRECQERRIQAQVHAIGDAAIDMFLDAVGAAGDRCDNPFGFSYRLNHVQLCRPDQIGRLAKVRPVCDIQPAMIPSDLGMLPSRLGAERADYGYFCKSLMNAGLVVNGSSDAGCDVMNPWRGIWAAVNRTDDDGNPPGGWKPREKTTLSEALRIYTWNPCLTTGTVASLGKIAPGYFADLAVLDRNIFDMDIRELGTVRSLATLTGGCLSHGEIAGWPSFRDQDTI